MILTYQAKGEEMSGACSMHENKTKYILIFDEKHKESHFIEDMFS